MRLRIDDFFLEPHVGVGSADAYQHLAKRAAKIGASSGTATKWFDHRCEEFRAQYGRRCSIEEFVKSKKDVRVVLHLWKTDEQWLEWFEPTLEVLSYLYKRSGGFRPSRLMDLQDMYFRFFDDMNNHEVVGKFISACLANTEPKRLLPAQRKLLEYRDTVFTKGGPIKVAQEAIASSKTHEQQIEGVGLRHYSKGRYAQACKNAYFVETVRGLKIGNLHPVLKELADLETKESSYDGKLNLGQKVGQVMIRRCAEDSNGMPERWVDYIKDLMCDPRIPVQTPRYQKWWAAMDRKDEENMRRWLAGTDLRLFLEILKESSLDKDLRRMYPARRKFLEGLLDSNDVVDARLFLSERAREMIRKQYGPKSLEAHGNLNDRDKSVIYVNVENKVHLFEGTHNYAARGGGVMPEGHRVLSRTAKSFTYRELSTGLDPELERAGRQLRPKRPETIYVRHHPPIGWQANMLLEFKYYGVSVDPEAVLSKADYLKFRRDYGI